MASTKQYHCLIHDKVIESGTSLNWRGVYSWFNPVSETNDYINYLIRNWSNKFYFIWLKRAYTGEVRVNLEDIGNIECDPSIIETAKGLYVDENESKEYIVKT